MQGKKGGKTCESSSSRGPPASKLPALRSTERANHVSRSRVSSHPAGEALTPRRGHSTQIRPLPFAPGLSFSPSSAPFSACRTPDYCHISWIRRFGGCSISRCSPSIDVDARASSLVTPESSEDIPKKLFSPVLSAMQSKLNSDLR